MIEDAWDDFPDKKETALEWDCPEHWLPQERIIPKQYKNCTKQKDHDTVSKQPKLIGEHPGDWD